MRKCQIFVKSLLDKNGQGLVQKLCSLFDEESVYDIVRIHFPSTKETRSIMDAENRDPAFFSMAIWAIWNRRNNVRLGKSTVPLGQLLSQAKERLREFNLHNSSTIIPVGRPPTCWQPPDRDTYKVNFDGARFA